jgi:methyl-accepting chemotaxis protein
MARSAGRAPSNPRPDEPRLPARALLTALRRLARGEADVRLPDEYGGLDAQICDAFNKVAERLAAVVDDAAGLETAIAGGRTGRRLAAAELPGVWRRLATHVNVAVDALAGHGDEL